MSPRTVASSPPTSRPSAVRTPIERVEVVVLAFDSPPGLLEDAVEAVAADADRHPGRPEIGVVVIDNGTSARARLAAVGLDRVAVVETGANTGYAGGMNVGLRRALDRGADAVALLNDDVVVEPNWLAPLVAELDADPTVAAAQPTLLSAPAPPDGDPLVNSAGVVIDRRGAGSDRLRGSRATDLPSAPADVDACTGGAVLIHRDYLAAVGVLDERFFLYYEDVELARRGARHGWRCRWVPASRVWHTGSATAERLGDDVRRLQERNRIWSSAMHGSPGEVARGVWLSVRRLRHEPRAVHRRALREGLAGVPVRLVERIRDNRQ